jgi:hypothetical protein
MKTKKYAEHIALKWRVEDININVESAFEVGHITEGRMNEMLSLTDSEKIALIEGAIGSIESHIVQRINEAIYESITEQTEY